MVRSITVIEHDSLDERSFTLQVEVLRDVIDLKEAIKQACEEYVSTREGRETYLYNCRNFNWADFEANVPNLICEKHGFRKLQVSDEMETVSWDEQLVDEENIYVNLFLATTISGRPAKHVFAVKEAFLKDYLMDFKKGMDVEDFINTASNTAKKNFRKYAIEHDECIEKGKVSLNIPV